MRYLVIIFFLASCNPVQDKVKNIFQTTVSVHDVIDEVNSKELYANISYIPLETANLAMVGKVDQLIVTKSRTIILSENRVLAFDMGGKSSFVINSPGRGPNEYL